VIGRLVKLPKWLLLTLLIDECLTGSMWECLGQTTGDQSLFDTDRYSSCTVYTHTNTKLDAAK